MLALRRPFGRSADGRCPGASRVFHALGCRVATDNPTPSKRRRVSRTRHGTGLGLEVEQSPPAHDLTSRATATTVSHMTAITVVRRPVNASVPAEPAPSRVPTWTL